MATVKEHETAHPEVGPMHHVLPCDIPQTEACICYSGNDFVDMIDGKYAFIGDKTPTGKKKTIAEQAVEDFTKLCVAIAVRFPNTPSVMMPLTAGKSFGYETDVANRYDDVMQEL